MILRKNRYVRVKIVGGGGIFDTIMNIVRKPMFQKFLSSAGKSVASALGNHVMNSVLPKTVNDPTKILETFQHLVNTPKTDAVMPCLVHETAPHHETTQNAVDPKLEEIIAKRSLSKASTTNSVSSVSGVSGTGNTGNTGMSRPPIRIQDYVKHVRGAGIVKE